MADDQLPNHDGAHQETSQASPSSSLVHSRDRCSFYEAMTRSSGEPAGVAAVQ